MADTAAVALASELLVDVRALGKKMSHVTTLEEAADVQRTAHGVIEVCDYCSRERQRWER